MVALLSKTALKTEDKYSSMKLCDSKTKLKLIISFSARAKWSPY